MHQGKLFDDLLQVAGCTYSGIVFRTTYISKYVQNFESNWKISVYIKVNNFAQFVTL